jgi:hypothetical protein
METSKRFTKAQIRKELSTLVSNRKRSWQTANFNIQSKLNALKTVNTNLEAAVNWGFEGHINLVYCQTSNIQEILPGNESKFQGLRQRILEIIEFAKSQKETDHV